MRVYFGQDPPPPPPPPHPRPSASHPGKVTGAILTTLSLHETVITLDLLSGVMPADCKADKLSEAAKLQASRRGLAGGLCWPVAAWFMPLPQRAAAAAPPPLPHTHTPFAHPPPRKLTLLQCAIALIKFLVEAKFSVWHVASVEATKLLLKAADMLPGVVVEKVPLSKASACV